MVASIRPLPAIGVPIKSLIPINGWDPVLSILQMQGGLPVVTVALNGAKNAGILVAQIFSLNSDGLQEKIVKYQNNLRDKVIGKSCKISSSR